VDDISFKIDVVSTVAYVDVCCSYSGGVLSDFKIMLITLELFFTCDT